MRTRTPGRIVAVLLLSILAAPAPSLAAELYDQLPPDRVLYVAPGQTLAELVSKAYPDRTGRWPEIQRWIVEHNPHAFIDGDAGRLRGDVRLQLPHPSALAARQDKDFGTGDAAFDLVFDGRFLFVNPSQSLEQLVPRVYPEQPDYWAEITESIIEHNRDVLDARDTRSEIARGTRLFIPNVRARRASAETAPPEPVVGTVVATRGAVTAVDAAGRRRELTAGKAVRRGDTVSTRGDAGARLKFNDGERMDLRRNSRIRVRSWSLPDVGPGRRVIGLLAGGLRAVSGAIGNRAEDVYRTVTPAATMGIRGTDYSLQICNVDECRNSAGEILREGLYVFVAEGEIELLNAGGDGVFKEGDFGYAASAEVAPVHLAENEAPKVLTVEPDVQGMGEASDEDDSANPWLWGAGVLLLLLAL